MAWHPMLQYENALNTRSLWYRLQGESTTPEAKHWLAGYESRWKGLPIGEAVTAGSYLLAGREEPWIAGVVTTGIWLLACWLFYHLARRELNSPIAGVAAMSFLLFHSLALVLSRSFQHEASALLGLLVAWWAVQQWDATSSWKACLLVAIMAGLALVTKPGVMFLPWCGVYLASCVERHGWKDTFNRMRFYLTPVMVLLPSLAWLGLMLPAGETHQWKLSMLLTVQWYEQTSLQILTVIGWVPIGILLVVTLWEVAQGRWRFLLWLAGCLGFLLLFCYAAMTHEYYLLALLPITALAVGRAIQLLGSCLPARLWLGPISIPLMLAAGLSAGIANLGWFVPTAGTTYLPILESGPYRPLETEYQVLGRQLGVGTSVIALTNDYAMPLRYFSGLHAQWWPTQLDLWYESIGDRQPVSAADRLRQLVSLHQARYFVSTLPGELSQQPELMELLKSWQEIPCAIPGWRVFELLSHH